MSATLPENELQLQLAAMRRELDALRQELAARPRVALRAEPGRRFLGQPRTVTVAVTHGPEGRPAVGVPVTLTTSWGRLVPHEGADRRPRSSVSGITDLDGTLVVELQPATADDLAPYQRELLAGALGLLEGAATPRDAETALAGLARLYRQSGSAELRRAVDLFFRDFGARARASVERREVFDDAWPTCDAALAAYVHAGTMQAPESAVLAVATLAVSFDDWLGPWLQRYVRHAADEDGIDRDLANARDRGEPATPMLDVIYTRVRSFVGSHPGAVGEFAAQQVTSNAMREFVLASSKVPVEVQAQLFPALETASSAMTTGASALHTLSRVRADLRGDLLDAKIATIDVGQITGLSTQLDGLRGQIAGKADQSALVSALATKVDTATLDQRLAAKVDTATFDKRLDAKVDTTALDQRLATLVDRATFDQRLTALDRRLQNTVDTSTFERVLATKVDTTTFERVLATKVDTTIFDQRLTTLVDTATFDQRLTTLVDTATFDQRLDAKVDSVTLDKRLDAKVDSVTFDKRLTALVDRATFDQRLTALDRRLQNTVDTTTFERVLATKVDTSTFERVLATKVDSVIFDQRLATKVDSTLFDQRLATKVDSTLFDQRLATKVDSTLFDQRLATKVDSTVFDQRLVTFDQRLATKIDQTVLEQQVAGRVDSILERALPQRVDSALTEFRRGLDRDLSVEFEKLRSGRRPQ